MKLEKLGRSLINWKGYRKGCLHQATVSKGTVVRNTTCILSLQFYARKFFILVDKNDLPVASKEILKSLLCFILYFQAVQFSKSLSF